MSNKAPIVLVDTVTYVQHMFKWRKCTFKHLEGLSEGMLATTKHELAHLLLWQDVHFDVRLDGSIHSVEYHFVLGVV